MEANSNGLVIYRASRLEALLPALSGLLNATWPENILIPQTIVAAHPGMKQWLSGALARQNGVSGISANLDIVLPSAWIDRLARRALGKSAISLPRYQRAHLRWAIYDLLEPGRQVVDITDPRIASYLSAAHAGEAAASDVDRRRFQLADKLAQVFSQYLMYRPDWLQAWQSGLINFASASLQNKSLSRLERGLLAPLWTKLTSNLGRHRADAIDELRDYLEKAPAEKPVLHVFGVSHLAPAELAIIRSYAKTAMVALYVPDPCREYWGGLFKNIEDVKSWDLYRHEEAARLDSAGSGDYWHEQGHPLLARWGRMGQHFFGSLADGDVSSDTRHWQDERPELPANRLERLQESIRQLAPELMKEELHGNGERIDESLMIHSCHTRLRELEVLHDALLSAMASQQSIQPNEMIVMMPDLQAYLPLIPAVFGRPGNAQEQLPYHLADAAVTRMHPLFTVFSNILKLPGHRITVSEVLDLLSVKELQRRFGFGNEQLHDLTAWLNDSRVAWALDSGHRAQFGVPPIPEFTFAWAVDRMVAGYLMSDASQSEQGQVFNLPDSTELAPVAGIQGPSSELLGILDKILQHMQRFISHVSEPRKASQWAEWLDRYLDDLLLIDKHDKNALDAWSAIKGFVHAISTEPASVELDPVLQFSVVRELLMDNLAVVPDRQHFLMGGITFCGMVPQRAIPFRLVAVLGLNDGEFPRRSSDAGLDLMTHIRRVGDRDVRTDDRYLFLETLMSARSRVHLSFIGQAVKDGKPRNPAAPLAELFAELDSANALSNDAAGESRPWLLKHPLQPFDERYFDGKDQRLFSYNERFAKMQGSGKSVMQPFLQGSALDPDDVPDPIALSELSAYYKDPAKNVLGKRLKLRLDALDAECLSEDEPMSNTIAPVQTVARKWFFNKALPAWHEEAVQQPMPAWLRLTGLLAIGQAGEDAWNNELHAIRAGIMAAHALPCLDKDVAQQGRSVPVDVEIKNTCADGNTHCRITGIINNVFPLSAAAGHGIQLVRIFPSVSSGAVSKNKPGLKEEQDLHFGDRVPLFLDWAILRLQTPCTESVRLTLLLAGTGSSWQAGLLKWDEELLATTAERQNELMLDLQSRVAKLIHWWQEAQRRPHWYFARTSWAAAVQQEKAGSGPLDKAAILNKWQPGFGTGEKDYGAGYNSLLSANASLDGSSPEFQELLQFAKELNAAISFHDMDGGHSNE